MSSETSRPLPQCPADARHSTLLGPPLTCQKCPQADEKDDPETPWTPSVPQVQAEACPGGAGQGAGDHHDDGRAGVLRLHRQEDGKQLIAIQTVRHRQDIPGWKSPWPDRCLLCKSGNIRVALQESHGNIKKKNCQGKIFIPMCPLHRQDQQRRGLSLHWWTSCIRSNPRSWWSPPAQARAHKLVGSPVLCCTRLQPAGS